MDSRSAAIALLVGSGRRAGPSSVAAPAGARARAGGSPVCPHRSRCSRSPIEAFTMTDPGVHDPDLGVQLGPKRAHRRLPHLKKVGWLRAFLTAHYPPNCFVKILPILFRRDSGATGLQMSQCADNVLGDGSTFALLIFEALLKP